VNTLCCFDDLTRKSTWRRDRAQRSSPARRLLAVLLLSALVPALADAQETTSGSIGGRVVDDQGLAVPGATVTVTSGQGAKTNVTDADGRFFIPFLTPGIYSVKVELTGFRSVEQSSVEVRLGQRLDLSFALAVGNLSEVVEVTSSAPVVDVSSTTVGATLDQSMLSRIPVGRRFTDALYIAAGVSSGGGTGQANPSIAGGSGLENNYVLDGVNITNAGYGAAGAYSTTFKTLGNAISYDFIKEVQIKTGGFEAEYGQASGGVVNVVTKSGSNNVDGSVFGYFQPDALESAYDQVVTINGTVNSAGSHSNEVGATVGGPIVHDKLFFFGAFNPQWQTRTMVAPADFPLASLGDVDRRRQTRSYAGKVTSQLTSQHRIDASFFGDPSSGKNGPQRDNALLRVDTAGFSEIKKYGGHNQSVKYDGIFTSHWFVEGSFGRATTTIQEVPSVDEWQVTDRSVVPNIRSGGIGAYEVGNEGENRQWQVKSTHIFGSHQLRYGLLYEDIRFDQISQRTGPTIQLASGEQTVTGASVDILADPVFGRIFRVTRANLTNVRETTQHYTSFFVQDTWRAGDRLTLKPGLRYEQQSLIGSLEDFTWKGNWAPRLGATFDPTGSGRMKVFGSYGWFFAKIPNDLAARALSADATVARADYFDAGLTQPIPEGVLAGGQTRHLLLGGTEAAVIDPDSKSMHKTEVIAGLEYEAFRGLNLSVRYINRTLSNVIEDMGTAVISLYLLGQADTVEFFISNPRDGFPSTVNGIGSFEKPLHTYNAVEVSADKRFSNNWSILASYRWSKLDGTYEGYFRNDNGQSDPAISSLYDVPPTDPTYVPVVVEQFGGRGDINFLGRAGKGPLPNDRPHQGKLVGNYTFESSLNLGASLFLSTGRPLTAFAAHPAFANSGEIPEGARGSGIQTVDGFRTRTPFEYSFDFHADYAVPLGGQRLVLLADIFNVFNTQRPLDYDNYTETSFLSANPDLGQTARNSLSTLQPPRQVRLGLRLQF
jgi:outer membrane receptor protein involved in Fe transport